MDDAAKMDREVIDGLFANGVRVQCGACGVRTRDAAAVWCTQHARGSTFRRSDRSRPRSAVHGHRDPRRARRERHGLPRSVPCRRGGRQGALRTEAMPATNSRRWLQAATGGSAGWPPQCPPSPPRPAQVDASVSVCLDVQNTLVNNVFRGWASEDLKARMWPRLAADTVASFCLSEAGSGSDAFALKTRAEAKGDYYVINGARAMWWGRDGEWIKIVTHQPLDTHCSCRRVQIVDHEWRRGGHLPCVCDRRFEQGLQGHHVLRGQQGRGGRRTRRWEGVSRLCGFARGDARTGASTHTRMLCEHTTAPGFWPRCSARTSSAFARRPRRR